MTAAAPAKSPTIAVIGNPNTGKSTLFSALTGVHARIGNYPGVTVEKKVGCFDHSGVSVTLVDLPGTYSLSPRSLDEMVSVDVLLGRQLDVGKIDAVLCIVDASNLERNLYVVSQVLDIGLPTVLVLNMWDVAFAREIKIDVAALSQRLGIPVLVCEAHKHTNIDAIKSALVTAAQQPRRSPLRLFPDEFYREVATLGEQTAVDKNVLPEFLLERLLLDAGGYIEQWQTKQRTAELPTLLANARERLKAAGCRIPAVEAKVRYAWARQLLTGVVQQPAQRPITATDKLDRILTHKVWGLAAFCLVMLTVFLSIYIGADPLMSLLEAGQSAIGDAIGKWLPDGPFRSLVVDGVIAGIGGVVVFVPQIALLFLFISILEDCGYMARAAFLMDKLMTKIGLSGKSFVPLMSSFACAIPGIMATRVIENRRDRFVTILVAPLMSCSARLPVYALLIGAFIPGIWYGVLQGLTLFAMTSLGVLVAIPIAWLLKKTVFQGETPPFVMELPSYKWPSPRIVLSRVYDRVKSFIGNAGTLIFATNVLVWAAAYYPGDHAEERRLQADVEALKEQHAVVIEQYEAADKATRGEPPAEVVAVESAQETVNRESQRLLEISYLGRAGKTLEPVFLPLGWDWRIGVGVLASFPAREVIVATLGTIYSLGSDVDAENEGLRGALQAATWPDGRPIYTIPVALSVMVFFALCAQCASTLMVIRRETAHWGWAAFTFTYMTTLAYTGAWLTYHVGNWLF